MKTTKLLSGILILFALISSCEKEQGTLSEPDPNDSVLTNKLPTRSKFIADFSVAKEEVLRAIPQQFIDKARNQLHVVYQHTSHGTHVSYGLFGLQDFKEDDAELFGVTNNDPTTGKLDFRDYALGKYATPGEDASDLSRNETAFIQATRNFLDDPENAVVNVVMWSWCDIAGHNVEGNYLPGMQTLIDEYGVGGSKIGNGEGQRTIPVTFIFMTGHANGDNNVGDGKPMNQAAIITEFCEDNRQFCLDYFSIDAHCCEGNFYDDVNDDGNSAKYGGNYFRYFQDTHTLGVHFYENKQAPGGSVTYGEHNTQHITANKKAYAMWWILARIAGWDGNYSN